MIHAAGESRRLPSYVPEGKLFAPVSAPSSSSTAPVVLDLILTLYLKYPWRDGELLVASGDVIIDFNTELLDAPDAAICGFAATASFESGSKHGVFVFHPRTGEVVDYFQKAQPAVLAQKARIEGSENCAIDLGIILPDLHSFRMYLKARARGRHSPLLRNPRQTRRPAAHTVARLPRSLSVLAFRAHDK